LQETSGLEPMVLLMSDAQINDPIKGVVVSISYLPTITLNRELKRVVVNALTEGGGLRQLRTGDCVSANEMIIADNGMCAVIEYDMDTGMLVKVFT
jgi:hypothetical protein